uniref:Uncharacterized protein n=1 Tax=Anopheles coluzzii TaxID=1518534 RepID=A0A8W7PQQ4_ANOCL
MKFSSESIPATPDATTPTYLDRGFDFTSAAPPTAPPSPPLLVPSDVDAARYDDESFGFSQPPMDGLPILDFAADERRFKPEPDSALPFTGSMRDSVTNVRNISIIL